MSPASTATSVPAPIAMPTSGRDQRRRVVHAVADHRDALALPLQSARSCRPCPPAAPARAPCRCRARARPRPRRPGVAGHHDDLDAGVVQAIAPPPPTPGAPRRPRRAPRAARLPSTQIDDALPARRRLVARSARSVGRRVTRARLASRLGPPTASCRPSTVAAHAAPGNRLERSSAGTVDAALLARSSTIARAIGCSASLLDGRREAQRLILAIRRPRCASRRRDARRA